MTEHIPTEHQEQVLVCDWLRARRVPFFAVPNAQILRGLKYGHAMLAKLHREGLTEGAPDLVLIRPGEEVDDYGIAHVVGPVAVEMKRIKRSTVSPAQKRMHAVLRAEGWIVLVCKGHRDAIAQLEGLGF